MKPCLFAFFQPFRVDIPPQGGADYYSGMVFQVKTYSVRMKVCSISSRMEKSWSTVSARNMAMR